MVWEETARKLQLATEGRDELERYVIQHHYQSGEMHRVWRELSEEIKSLKFRLDWEFRQDNWALSRE